jgi:hypothetical protein
MNYKCSEFELNPDYPYEEDLAKYGIDAVNNREDYK